MAHHYNVIKSLVKDSYELFKDYYSYGEAIERAVSTVLQPVDLANIIHPTVTFRDKDDLKDLLISELQYEVNINRDVDVGEYHTLTDASGHIPWYRDKLASGQIDWRFWKRYRKYLINIKGWGEQTVTKLDEVTDDIMERIEDPTVLNRPFYRKGLVVGYVQSGKTANFMGLINKAIDAGYRIIIVLSGMHNNLRSQTQMRIDEEIIGRDTSDRANQLKIGVTTLPGEGYINIDTFTTQADRGDFNRAFAQQVGGVQPGSDRPMMFVVKKHASVLRNLAGYFREAASTLGEDYTAQLEDGNLILNNLPLLLIDDEADQATPNTRPLESGDTELDPTAINRGIRELLNLFNQKAYVGYTATPFANIFIHHTGQHTQYGQDLFPSSFIISLDAPSNYFGPVRVFGLIGDDNVNGIPIFIPVYDASATNSEFLPLRHRSDAVPGFIPDSMKDAIKSFIISSAIRRARGQGNKHNTMLIHCTRFTDIQAAIGRHVEEEFTRLRDGITNNDSDTIEELRLVWERDYPRISGAMHAPAHTWEVVMENLEPAILKMQRRPHIVNGTAGDILDYKQYESIGLSVIAIGGDKLSRGLTLDGLTVSYFTRTSSLYDTLMQMGRWFGYRTGYEDLCRLYTTPDLYEWYRHISTAFESLRQEFLRMSRAKLTPTEFGLRVLAHPDMMATSAMKMRHTEKIKLKYQGSLTETTTMARDRFIIPNYVTTEAFISNLGSPDVDENKKILWRNIPAATIMGFLSDFTTYKGLPAANTSRIVEYIELQLGKDEPELLNWNVALVTKKRDTSEEPIEFAGHTIVPYTRTISRPLSDTIFIQRIISKTDELIDFNEDEILRYSRAKNLDLHNTPADSRDCGPRETNPLLMIYVLDIKNDDNEPISLDRRPIAIAISWPVSESAIELEYDVNTVYQELEFAQYD